MTKKTKIILFGGLAGILLLYVLCPEVVWAIEAFIGIGTAVLITAVIIWGHFSKKKTSQVKQI